VRRSPFRTNVGGGPADLSTATGKIAIASIADIAALSVLGNPTNAAGAVQAIVAANDGEVVRRSGSAVGFGALNLAAAAAVAGKLPWANLADVSATSRILSRRTAGAGVIEESTLSQILDFIGGATWGDILFRGTANWQRLPAGTSGQFLQTRGAGADPVYASALTPGSDQSLYSASHFFSVLMADTNNATVPVGIRSAAVSLVGATWTVTFRDALYQAGTTGAAIGNTVGVDVIGSGWIDWSWPFDITFIVRTGADITNIRLWIGVSSSALGNADTAAQRTVAFRYSTVAGDGGWVGVNYDGTTQSNTATVAAIAASTKYKLRIRSDGTQSWFSVNGGAEVNLNTNFPGGTTRVGTTAHIYTTANAAKVLEFCRVFGFDGA